MVRPCGARGFVDPGDAVLHQCIRPLIGACAPGHHGYQRALELISGQASTGPFGSPVFASAGKTDFPSSSQPLADERFEKARWLPSLSLVKEPVHICWGDADAVSPAKVARHLKEHVCPRARLTLMPGVGHFCQLSDPDMWLASVAAFYNEECGLGGCDRMK